MSRDIRCDQSQMVTWHLLGTGKRLQGAARWVGTQDWFCLYEELLSVGRRLLLTLMGLNRVWTFTDNPNFKGLKSFADRFALQPGRFVDRIGGLLQGDALTGIRGFVDLSEEILDLVEAHVPDVDTADEREILDQARRRAHRGNP